MKNNEVVWLLNEKYSGVETPAFFVDCARLEAGEPLAFIIGSIPFLDCTIHLDSHPLIPRPETEFWTEQAIKAIRTRRDLVQVRGLASYLAESPRILDLCAGSGAIGVAVARAVPSAEVTFAELDPAHLPTIQKNLTENVAEYPNRSTYYPVIESDLFSNVTSQFDFILSNPPYIDAAAHTVDASVTEFEPHLALFGGMAGMELIARIIAQAADHLTPTGQLWLEHEPAQVSAIAALATLHGFSVVTHPDQYDIPRFSVLSMAQ